MSNSRMPIPWVDNYPSRWTVMPLFALAGERFEKNAGLKCKNVLSLSYGKIVKRDVSSNAGLLPESFDTYQIVKPGDIVLRLLDLQNDKDSLRVGLVTEMGIVTSAYLTIAVKQHDRILPEYLSQLLHCYDLQKVFYSFGGGIRQSANFEDMRRMPILVPPLEEQRMIISWVSGKATLIDQIAAGRRIEKTVSLLEKMAATMQEYKSSLIYEAVTGQIDFSGNR